MSRIVVLGTSNAVPAEGHENTHLVLEGTDGLILIDCGSNPIVRMQSAGLDPARLTDLIITHFHPDHTAGLPLLVLDLWLMGRKRPLRILGLEHAIVRVRTLLSLYDLQDWPNMFDLDFVEVPNTERALVLETGDFAMMTSPVRHLIPTIGLRVDFAGDGRSFAYSSDTAISDEFVRLAEGADVVVHEASGEGHGHSTAADAGEVAARAGAGSLVLIHYPTGAFFRDDLLEHARSRFSGSVSLARDFMTMDFSDHKG